MGRKSRAKRAAWRLAIDEAFAARAHALRTREDRRAYRKLLEAARREGELPKRKQPRRP